MDPGQNLDKPAAGFELSLLKLYIYNIQYGKYGSKIL